MCGSGFEVKVIAPESYVKRDSGLIYWDIEVGNGDCPKDGQQVWFSFQNYKIISSIFLQNQYLSFSGVVFRLENHIFSWSVFDLLIRLSHFMVSVWIESSLLFERKRERKEMMCPHCDFPEMNSNLWCQPTRMALRLFM